MKRRKWIALWGLAWVTLLLARAIWRLTPLALEPWLQAQMSFGQQGLYIAWLLFNAYAEGYRGFQLRFCPRVVARAQRLAEQPTPLRFVLALPYCMSLFADTRRQTIVSWILVVSIVSLVIAVRALPQPWRGIIDGGVVVGLLWGVMALWWIAWRRLFGGGEPYAQPST